MQFAKTTLTILALGLFAVLAPAAANGSTIYVDDQAAYDPPPEPADPDPADGATDAPFAPGEVIVRFARKPDGSTQSVAEQNTLLSMLSGASVSRSYRIVPGLSLVKLPEGTTVEEALGTLERTDGVLYAEPNYTVKAASTFPDDTRFDELWGMHNTGQTGGTPDADIDAPEAWDLYTGSSEIVVAVIDSGVDYNHPDLADNMWVNPGEIPGNGIDDDGNGFVDDVYGYDFRNDDGDPWDDHSHGTHCAGTIGAIGNNGNGVAGVCWNVRIMVVKFLSSCASGSTSDAISSIQYSVQMGAKLSSNSWGGSRYSQALKDTIDAAGQAGCLFLASAGNDYGTDNDTEPHYPASYDSPNLISVMATDHNDQMSDFSNYGLTSVDLGAPGSDILSCQPGGGCQLKSGTSMATPHVAGACALMWSANPALPYEMIKDALLQSVDPTLPGLCVSGGRLNLYQAILHTAGSQGCVFLDKDLYPCSDVISIELRDFDLRAATTQDVAVTTDGGDSETVILTGAPANTGVFKSTIPTAGDAVSIHDGTLQVAHGETITVTYQDLDDGTGNPATATDTASADCEPPTILNVQVSPPPVTVTFETNEPTTGCVRSGLACGGPYIAARQDPALQTNHTIELRGLGPGDYYCVVDAADNVGNAATDDNGGSCYPFTVIPLRVPDPYPTIQAAIDAAVDGEEVLVSPGTYTGDGNRGLHFGNGLPAGRTRAITVRSESGPDTTIIDCQGAGRAFYFRSGEGSASVVDGFTITNGAEYYGGGIRCSNSSPTISNCTIIGNSANSSGGGISCWSSSPTITNCTITDSSGHTGGGICCSFSSPTITNCTITGNSANSSGGGIYCSAASPSITSCTISRNSAYERGGAIYCYNDANPTITNCILWGDTADQGPEIALASASAPSSLMFLYSDVQGGQPVVYVEDGCTLQWGEGNIDLTPGFAFTDDYHLIPGSPCIDAGTNEPPGGLPPTDLDGNPRPLDGDGNGDPVADIGACEYNPQAPSLAVSPPIVEFFLPEGTPKPPDQILSVRNCGGGTLNWEVAETCDWLEASPRTGDSTGEVDEVMLSVDASGLSPGNYTCVLTVSDPQAVNSPRIVTATLHVHGTLHVPSEYQSIQAAIDIALDGDVVLVADGTYTGDDNRDLDFGGKAITVRSENGPAGTVIDCEGAGCGFYLHSGEGPASVVEGFTITNGYGSDFSGGIACRDSSSPTITNCILTNNSGRGGAIFCGYDSSPTITNCTISGNSTGLYGGGILCYDSSPTISNCTISGNSASGSAGGGGGIYCEAKMLLDCDISPTITNCTITGNSANDGGGIGCRYPSRPTITNCTISGNSAGEYGGGIHCGFGRLIVTNNNPADRSDHRDGESSRDCDSTPIISNCTITANSAGEGGGGIYWEGGSPTITNSTISRNSAGEYGGGIHCWLSSPTITNCILWGDTAAQGPEIALTSGQYPSSSLTLLYSDVQGGPAAAYIEDGCTLEWGEGNLDVSPGLAFTDDCHLSPGSPCIDSGTNDPPGGLPITDLDGSPRPLDGDGDGDAIADMGAYEYNPDGPPRIALSPTVIDFFAFESDPIPDDQTLSVQNCGGGTLNWEVTETCGWLQVAPRTGHSTGEVDEVVLSADASGLSPGDYTCVLTVSGPQAANSPRAASVNLHLRPTLHVPSQYPTIQEAIDAAQDHEEVLVADGTYTGDGNKNLDFAGKAITVRSENGPAATIIDCQGRRQGFSFHSREGAASVIEGFTITNGRSSYGGGIYCSFSSPTITNCTISGDYGGRGGGGIYCGDSSPTIINCTISGNSASGTFGGGGICCRNWSSPTITNCTITGNSVGNSGGGISCFHGGSPTITNCTISGNAADEYGGAIFCYYYSIPTIANCILWGNTAAQGPEIALTSAPYPSSLTLLYSDVQGGQAAAYIEDGCTLDWADGNIDADPMFVRNPDDGGDGWGDDPDTPEVDEGANDDYGDLHLQPGSPCIDAGDNDADVDAGTPEIDPLPDTDLDGRARFLDDPHAADTGNGTPPIVDMGPYEFMRVFLDIRPGGCPNPFNPRSHGVLPVAVLGSEAFDVSAIDRDSILLTRAGVEGGIAPKKVGVEDVATPFQGQLCGGHELGADGWPDLALKFRTQEVVELLSTGAPPNGPFTTLTVTGSLLPAEGGGTFAASDCIRLFRTADFDGDSDVDQADFGHFQTCLTGPDRGPRPPGCQNADLDEDGDVDQSDFGLFQGCISGAGVPTDPTCMH